MRPFRPFEVRMINGRKFRFNRVERCLVAREHLITLDRSARTVWINYDRISGIGPARGRHPRTER